VVSMAPPAEGGRQRGMGAGYVGRVRGSKDAGAEYACHARRSFARCGGIAQKPWLGESLGGGRRIEALLVEKSSKNVGAGCRGIAGSVRHVATVFKRELLPYASDRLSR